MTQLEIIFSAADAHLVDRDECEDALDEMLTARDLGEVTGAGRSLAGQMDLVVEVGHPVRALPTIRELLRKLRVPASTRIRQAGPPDLVMGVYDDGLPSALGRAPRRDRIRWKPAIGEVFGIQLADTRWAYGRVSPQKDFYEFFELVTVQPATLAALAGVPTFRLDCLFDLSASPDAWPSLGVLPYESFEPQLFRIAYAACPNVLGKDGFLHCGNPDYARVLSESEVATLPAVGTASSEVMRTMLAKRLVARFSGR